jgi:hypothetical protein
MISSFVTGEAGTSTTVTLTSVKESVHVHYTECSRLRAYILNIFIEKINIARRVRFSPHDSGTVEVLLTILVLSSSHDCAHECAYASISGHLSTGWTLCEKQTELRSKCNELVEGGEKTC